MAINALLTKVIFDKNPDHEFYVEESFPLEWMYPHLTPFGIIMKINRQPLTEMSQEVVDTDHKFWRQFSTRLIGDWIDYDTPVSNICAFAEQVYYEKKRPADFKGDPRFLRDNDGQKAFSKLRSSIAGLYAWRMQDAARRQNIPEYQRMMKEAEFAFKQAYAYCPYSPEAIFRYINLLITMGRVDEAILMATTSQKLDPFNAQIEGLIYELKRIKASMPGQAAAPSAVPPATPGADPASLEQAFNADPKNVGLAYQLANAYAQQGQADKIIALLDRLVSNARTDSTALMMAANFYGQLGQLPRAENALLQLVKVSPQNPEGTFDLAAIQAMQSKSNQAIENLRSALDQSAKRLTSDSNALNLYSNALTDQRFASLRGWTEFDRLMAGHQPK
jgi:tetratricopeptide (TPR) repeat protein